MSKKIFVLAAADEPLAVEPAGGWPADEYTGKGGSYVRDPVTGLRRPAEPAPEAPETLNTPDADIPASGD